MGILNDDYVYKEDPPAKLFEVTSRATKEKYVQWYESNKMALELALDIMNSKNRRKRKVRAMNSTPSSSKAGMNSDLDKIQY